MFAVLIAVLLLTGICIPEAALPTAQPHVIFFALSAVLWGVGKGVTALAPAAEASLFWRVFRRTLPWHPVIAGAGIGVAFPELVPGAPGKMFAAIYFAAAGIFAAYDHDLLRTWGKFKLPGAAQ